MEYELNYQRYQNVLDLSCYGHIPDAATLIYYLTYKAVIVVFDNN